MIGFFKDTQGASKAAHQEAQRELVITLIVTVGAFVIVPVIFAALIVPIDKAAPGFFHAFNGADIYIASISLLSISIYSISKEYQSENRDRFGFPHAATIMAIAIVILLLAIAAYTARVVADALPSAVEWHELLAQILGWIVFLVSGSTAYAVLVLRNDMETGASRQTRNDEDMFVHDFAEGKGAA